MGTVSESLPSESEVQPGLQANAIGFVDAVSIGLNATWPAYSLASVLGPIVVLVGVAAAGILLASFVPMLLIASAFYVLNRVDPDCGKTFSWVSQAMGPWFGWLGGWAIAMTGVRLPAREMVFAMTKS
jgi:amino acid transporter